MNKLVMLLLWGLPLLLTAQIKGDSLAGKPAYVLSGLPATRSMAVDDEGNIFVLDETNRLHKFLKISNYDSSVVVGGQSVRDEGFLNPTQLSSRNRQSLYMLDEGLQRIILFNPNLRIVKEIDFLALNQRPDIFLDNETIVPASFDIGPTGELFVLNAQDNKVYKIDLFGQIESSFGGSDYGAGSLFAPYQIQLTKDNRILVSDTTEQCLIVYNLYGIFEENLSPKVPFRWQSFCLGNGAICLYRGNKIFLFDPLTQQGKMLHLKLKKPLRQVFIRRDYIYLLYENEVHLHQK